MVLSALRTVTSPSQYFRQSNTNSPSTSPGSRTHPRNGNGLVQLRLERDMFCPGDTVRGTISVNTAAVEGLLGDAFSVHVHLQALEKAVERRAQRSPEALRKLRKDMHRKEYTHLHTTVLATPCVGSPLDVLSAAVVEGDEGEEGGRREVVHAEGGTSRDGEAVRDGNNRSERTAPTSPPPSRSEANLEATRVYEAHQHRDHHNITTTNNNSTNNERKRGLYRFAVPLPLDAPPSFFAEVGRGTCELQYTVTAELRPATVAAASTTSTSSSQTQTQQRRQSPSQPVTSYDPSGHTCDYWPEDEGGEDQPDDADEALWKPAESPSRGRRKASGLGVTQPFTVFSCVPRSQLEAARSMASLMPASALPARTGSRLTRKTCGYVEWSVQVYPRVLLLSDAWNPITYSSSSFGSHSSRIRRAPTGAAVSSSATPMMDTVQRINSIAAEPAPDVLDSPPTPSHGASCTNTRGGQANKTSTPPHALKRPNRSAFVDPNRENTEQSARSTAQQQRNRKPSSSALQLSPESLTMEDDSLHSTAVAIHDLTSQAELVRHTLTTSSPLHAQCVPLPPPDLPEMKNVCMVRVSVHNLTVEDPIYLVRVTLRQRRQLALPFYHATDDAVLASVDYVLPEAGGLQLGHTTAFDARLVVPRGLRTSSVLSGELALPAVKTKALEVVNVIEVSFPGSRVSRCGTIEHAVYFAASAIGEGDEENEGHAEPPRLPRTLVPL